MKHKTLAAGAGSLALAIAALGFQFLDVRDRSWGSALLVIAGLLILYSAVQVFLWAAPLVRFRLIPLPEAARLLYREARARNFVWAKAAEQTSGPDFTNGSPEEVLDWFADIIASRAEIMGIRPPSTAREPVRARGGSFEDGAKLYRSPEHVFTELVIRRHDCRQIAKQIRERKHNEELEQKVEAASGLRQLQDRRNELEAARTNVHNFVWEAKRQVREVDHFIQTAHNISSPMSGSSMMQAQPLAHMTRLLQQAVRSAKETGLADDLEAPVFVPPPDTNLRQTGKNGESVFYKDDNWPYMSELVRFSSRSGDFIQKLEGQLQLLKNELKATNDKISETRSRLSKKR